MKPVIILREMVDHSAAPLWYVAEFGREAEPPVAGLSCPLCTAFCRLDEKGAYVIARGEGVEELPVTHGPLKRVDSERKTDRDISIPILCEAGHRMLLCFDTDPETGWLQFYVGISDEAYQNHYSDAYETWSP